MQMNYKEQLQYEIAQAQSQLQELDKLEQAKMKQRNLINNQLLKIAMKKQEAQATITNNRELLRMTMSFK
ncbi:hypothetical protein [Streptococcus parasanguinis]|uniref:hypothetical protein n=1 Tax=Streptococcus parasanguinis TaxID=1318 RepID=UPI0039C46402